MLATVEEKPLAAEVARRFPVQAIAALRQSSWPGPLYNTYDWGGFLILHYPEHPVSIDGRTLVHGAPRVLRCTRTERGEEGWQSDPELAAARLIILPRKLTLTSLLRRDARFRVEYEDAVAVVFVRR